MTDTKMLFSNNDEKTMDFFHPKTISPINDIEMAFSNNDENTIFPSKLHQLETNARSLS